MRVTLSKKEAQALHWFLRHMSFNDALSSIPPHIGKELRENRAYDMMHAATSLQLSIERANIHGDAWMYAGVKP